MNFSKFIDGHKLNKRCSVCRRHWKGKKIWIVYHESFGQKIPQTYCAQHKPKWANEENSFPWPDSPETSFLGKRILRPPKPSKKAKPRPKKKVRRQKAKDRKVEL